MQQSCVEGSGTDGRTFSAVDGMMFSGLEWGCFVDGGVLNGSGEGVLSVCCVVVSTMRRLLQREAG